jgi:hypothetical protein
MVAGSNPARGAKKPFFPKHFFKSLSHRLLLNRAMGQVWDKRNKSVDVAPVVMSGMLLVCPYNGQQAGTGIR